jgi:hypothetical protein
LGRFFICLIYENTYLAFCGQLFSVVFIGHFNCGCQCVLEWQFALGRSTTCSSSWLLALSASVFLWKTPRAFYASRTLTLLLIPFSLGLLSSLLAEYPSYALKDWSIFVGFVFLAYFFSARCATETTLLYGLWGLALAALLNAYFFLLYYALAFISQIYVLDAYVLFYGFSNPRFLNQFQGWPCQ